MSFRTYIPDVRCICGKVILNSVRNDYQRTPKGDYPTMKLFMQRNGISKECCMDSLMNVTSFPVKFDVPQTIGKEKTTGDIKNIERLAKLNTIFEEYKSGIKLSLDSKVNNDFKLTLESKLTDLFEELELYDTVSNESFRDRFELALESKNYMLAFEVCKEYIYHLGKQLGLSKLSNTRIELTETVPGMEPFIAFLKDKEKVPFAEKRLYEVYTFLYPGKIPKNNYFQKYITGKIDSDINFTIESIQQSFDTCVEIFRSKGWLPIWWGTDLRVGYDPERNINFVFPSKGTLKSELEKLGDISNGELIIDRWNEKVTVKRNGEFIIEKKPNPTIKISDFNFGDALMRYIVSDIESGIFTIKDISPTKHIDIDCVTPSSKFVLRQINHALDKFYLFNDIQKILTYVNDVDAISKIKSLNLNVEITSDRIQKFIEYKERAIKMFDIEFLYWMWNNESFEDFVDMIEPSVRQLISVFDGYRYSGEKQRYTDKLFDHFEKWFLFPGTLILESYQSLIDFDEEDMIEAYSYLINPNKKLPKASGYFVGNDEGEGEQAELSNLIEGGI